MPIRPATHEGGVKVRAFEAKDEPGVLEVLQAAFGQWPRDIHGITPSEFFRWKHMDGPFGPSSILVAEADGTVIGCQGYMPWRLQAGEQILLTIRRIDLAVHPSYRRRGVSMAIRAAASFPGDAAFTWTNANRQSRRGTRKAGLRTVSMLPRFAQPHGPLHDTVRRAWVRGSNTPDLPQIEAATAAEVLRDDEHASLLRACADEPDDRLATVKDLDYLRWRYGHFDEYRAALTDAGDGGCGLVIFRVGSHGPFLVSRVCELFVERSDRGTVRRLLRLVRDAAPADFVSCSFSSRGYAAMCGFMQYPSRTDLMAYPLQQNLVPDPTKRASWALSVGDLELL
jgi:GNAT superfamily N-acetyltransferase